MLVGVMQLACALAMLEAGFLAPVIGLIVPFPAEAFIGLKVLVFFELKCPLYINQLNENFEFQMIPSSALYAAYFAVPHA